MGSTTDTIPDVLTDTHYRVSAKALIFDDQDRLLVAADKNGEWEVPGGGWSHDETFEECIARELWEELRAKVIAVGEVTFVYRGSSKGRPKLSLATQAQVEGTTFVPTDDDLVEARFVTRQELLQLPFQESEKGVLDCVDKIWPLSLKK